MSSLTKTPIANSILSSAEGQVDELDLLAEIESAVNTTTVSQPSHHSLAIGLLSQQSKLFAGSSGILDADESDSEIEQPPLTALPSSATGTKSSHQSTPPTTPATHIQSYKRKRSDTPVYSSIEQQHAEQVQRERDNQLLKQRHTKFVKSLTAEQRQRYSLHNTITLDTVTIKKLLTTICQTSKISNQLPSALSDALKCAIMYITETARELQQRDRQLRFDGSTDEFKDAYSTPLTAIQPVYYKLAYAKLSQEGKLPSTRAVYRKQYKLFNG